MCVILQLSPGASIKKDHLFNACYNNWHGYGLVLVDGNKKAQLIKKFDEKGNDPEEIWKLLEDNKDIERYLHVRYSTKGATDESNTQPFQVYNSNKRQVWFMHNGTLSSFGGSYTSATGKSDTLDFCEKILIPSLQKWVTIDGVADYTDKAYLDLVVDKQWVSHSMGLFVSNDLPAQRIGNGWSEYKHTDEESSGEVWVSNTTYFDKVSRGPMFQKFEAIRKAKEEEERKTALANAPFQEPFVSSGSTAKNTEEVKTWAHGNTRSQKIIKAITDICDTWNLDDARIVSKLSYIAYDEWVAFIEQEGEFAIAALLEKMCEHVNVLTIRENFLERKLKKAEKTIEASKKVEKNVGQVAA